MKDDSALVVISEPGKITGSKSAVIEAIQKALSEINEVGILVTSPKGATLGTDGENKIKLVREVHTLLLAALVKCSNQNF